MTITIQIDTDNDAFKGPDGEGDRRDEVERILREWLRSFERHDSGVESTTLFDVNGNTVGHVTIKD